MKKLYKILFIKTKFPQSYHQDHHIGVWESDKNEFHTANEAIHYLQEHPEEFSDKIDYFVQGIYHKIEEKANFNLNLTENA